MKNSLLSLLILLCGSAYAAPSYTKNSFTMMPHHRIMDININECKVMGNATGQTSAADECIYNQKKSFEYLQRIHDAQEITSASWSLCVGESKTRHSYNYLVMLACMKVVKDICPERPDGNWVNPNMCIDSIRSGAWVNNPKIFEPTKYSN